MAGHENEDDVPLSTRIEQIPYVGYIAIVLSALFISFTTLGVNLLVNDMNPVESLLISYLFLSLVYFAAIMFQNVSFKWLPGEKTALVLRCISGAWTAIAAYKATTMLNIGDATAIILSSPIYVSIVALIFLGEPFEILHLAMILVNFIGVIFIAKPPFIFSHFSKANKTRSNSTVVESTKSMPFSGLILANAAAFGIAAFMVALRKLKETPVFVSIFWTGFVTVLNCVIYLVFVNDFKVPVTSKPYWLLLFSAVSLVLGLYFQTLALRVEKAGPIAMVRNIQVVFAYIQQVIILKQAITWTSLLGALIIIGTVIASALYKLWLNKKTSEIHEREQSEEGAKEQTNMQQGRKSSKTDLSKTSEESNVENEQNKDKATNP